MFYLFLRKLTSCETFRTTSTDLRATFSLDRRHGRRENLCYSRLFDIVNCDKYAKGIVSKYINVRF